MALACGALATAGLALLLAKGPAPSPETPHDAVDDAGGEDRPALAGRPSPTVAPPRPEVRPAWTATFLVLKGWTDEPVAGASVEVRGADGVVRTLTTNAEGKASVADLPPGEARAFARADGYAVSDDLPIRAEWATGGRPWELRVEEAEAVSGVVVESDSVRAVQGARVTALLGGAVCMNPPPAQRIERTLGATVSDARGAFRFERVPARPFCALRVFRVDAAGYRTVWHVPREQTGPGPVEIRLVPGGTIEGVVTGPDGAPHPGAKVVAVLNERAGTDPLAAAADLEIPKAYIDRLYVGTSVTVTPGMA